MKVGSSGMNQKERGRGRRDSIAEGDCLVSPLSVVPLLPGHSAHVVLFDVAALINALVLVGSLTQLVNSVVFTVSFVSF